MQFLSVFGFLVFICKFLCSVVTVITLETNINYPKKIQKIVQKIHQRRFFFNIQLTYSDKGGGCKEAYSSKEEN